MASIAKPEQAPSKADTARERELFRYFQPPENSSSTLNAHEASSPDTTLTALAQLCAIRLNAKRAMISVLDRQNQYFIAEATKSLDLVNNNKSEVEGDGLWFGCGTVDKSGRLCEKTIELPISPGSTPCFQVGDLSQDERFNQLPFVKGPPYFKYYAGTPLTTRKGINIGSLFIIDDVIRGELRHDQEQFLGTIAQTIMKHLEMAGEAQERRKVMRLSMGMNAFVEGKSGLDPKDLSQDPSTIPKPAADGFMTTSYKKRSEAANRSSRNSPTKDAIPLTKQGQTDNTGSPSDSETSQDESESNQAPRSLDSGHRVTFARAANILCESLDVKDQGGVVFFDTTSRLRTLNDSSEDQSARVAEVLGFSTTENEMGLGDQSNLKDVSSFSPIEESLLSPLLSRYRRGKMWTFVEDGSLSSSEDDTASTANDTQSHKGSRINRNEAEVLLLQKHFPGVRQLIFSGLWDSGSSRWFAGGFAWTTSNSQIFTKETELSYFLAFGNSVMAEVSRLASVRADRQKADFIGSISHEFRSPLHGILASAEFLAETEVDGFQGSLVDTISSCGRTLLDTINHILDYSKINSFERSWRNVRKPGVRARAPANRRIAGREAPPTMNIYATIDVAAITEEVVEGVYAGQIYQDISSTDTTDFSIAARADAVDRGIASTTRKRGGRGANVEVHIDIDYDDYTFTSQPGALKRIILNVFGNALKYTQKGSIIVKLSLERTIESNNKPTDERVLELNIVDTGKGISSEYLRTSLFNPFCQEDPLASGTGLGLSIVRSIVTMLGGNIDIRSQVGQGTEVSIRLPLSRLPGTDTAVSTPSSSTTESSVGDAVNNLKSDHEHASVALGDFDDRQRSVLANYIEHWFGFELISSSSNKSAADICIVDEKEHRNLPRHGQRDLPTVVLCNNATRAQTSSRHHNIRGLVEYVSKPFGPRKLAKALRSCLERVRASKTGLVPLVAFSDESSPLESEADTVIPDLEMERLTLGDVQGDKPLEVQTNGVVTVGDSENARMAIDTSSSTSGDVTVTEEQAFPFPTQNSTHEERKADESESQMAGNGSETARYRGDLVRRDSRRPPLTSRMTEPIARTSFVQGSVLPDKHDERITPLLKPPDQSSLPPSGTSPNREAPSNLTVSNIALHNRETSVGQSGSDSAKQEKRCPRLLLVDDNRINLRLLETYMRKRKAKLIDLAENGQLAVQAAEAHELGYDIIFMDISMPIMNGFEATRAIRDIEESRSRKDGETRSPSFIVALTGLASSRDQTEAFTSGVDLFMTKPVSFKEVGRLLDNWEAHGGMKP